ncbi:MAG: hypothetical protein ABFD92_19355 [Planctomycetaceae bacterium]|nr:hypothetical protein [Planctomycetaceae bacterium]
MKRVRRTICCAVVLALATGCLFGQTASSALPAESPSLAGVLDAILQEAQRQEKVSGDMVRLLGQFRALVNDLQSNKLLSEANGESLNHMAAVIATTDRAHVRAAAAALRTAGTDASSHAAHVRGAAEQIQQALELLTELLRQSDALAAGEAIDINIAQIMIEQKGLLDETVQIAKTSLSDPSKADVHAPALAARQEKIADRVTSLQGLLGTILEAQTNPKMRERLERAVNLMDERKIDVPLQTASRDITQRDMLAAVGLQKQGLKDLKELADILSADSKDSPDAKDSKDGKDGKDGKGKDGKGKDGKGKDGKGGKASAIAMGIKPAPAGRMGGKMLGEAPDDGTDPAAVTDKNSRWAPLDRTDRKALDQSFARELPREYRDLLMAYYELLARQ